ncbi:Uncharacterised protein r2_g1691 [Pycnogonum litorale]
MFLVVVDAFSKYLDVIPMQVANSSTTVQALRHLFRYFGLPEHIATDNGPQFTSAEFKKFVSGNDIMHTLTAPHHPATNGLAERYVGIFKTKMKQMGMNSESLAVKLDRFLFAYCTTPSLGQTPAELLMNRQPRIRLSALRANFARRQLQVYEQNVDISPKFRVSQSVFVFNYGKGRRWIPGKIIEVISDRNYRVQVGDVILKRHENQLRLRDIPIEQYSADFQPSLAGGSDRLD